jgi:putative ABC transport system permease protein
MHDLRFAIRAIRAAPLVSAAAIVSLALGIGANTAVFSVVNAILLKPAPYPEPDRLVLLGYTFSGASVLLVSETKLNVWKDQTTAWQDIAALRSRNVNVSDGSRAEQVLALQTNTDFFTVFGARAAFGRTFTRAEDQPGGDHVVVLSDGFWKRRFGADPRAVGTQLRVDGSIATIVGVLDASVDTSIFNVAPDVWIPLQLDSNSTSHGPSLIAAGRLRPSMSVALAQAQAHLAGEAFRRRYPQVIGPNDTFTVASFQEALVHGTRSSLLVFAGAVAFVLLIACANVANLALIRGSVRQREIAIRAAMGASRWQIVRQLLTESVVLTSLGGGLGLVLGALGIRALLAMNPSSLPRIGSDASGVTVDWRVLSFALAVSVTAALLCGVWPALRLSRGDLNQPLRGSGGRAGSTRRERYVRSLLVVGELALALVLLVGAMLLIRTFAALHQVDRGFDLHKVLTLRVALTDPRFAKTEAVSQVVRMGVQRVTALPGVIRVAATRTLPLESDWRTSVRFLGRPPGGPSPLLTSYRIISPGYFDVLNIPIVRGRDLMDRDEAEAPPVAIINQEMARRYWYNGDPLNDRIIAFPGRVPDEEPARQIVGIVANVRDGMPLDQEQQPVVYVPLAQLLDRESAVQAGSLAWIVRTRAEPGALGRIIEREISAASGGAPISNVKSMDEIAVRAIAPTTFSMTLLMVFGGCALLLAAVGMYSVMAYAVQQRTYEIGVRLALGAGLHQVRNMVLVDGLKLASYSVALGGVTAAALAGTLRAFLFGIRSHDVVTFAVTPVLVGVVALAAVWIPARRASRIDAAEVLKGL